MEEPEDNPRSTTTSEGVSSLLHLASLLPEFANPPWQIPGLTPQSWIDGHLLACPYTILLYLAARCARIISGLDAFFDKPSWAFVKRSPSLLSLRMARSTGETNFPAASSFALALTGIMQEHTACTRGMSKKNNPTFTEMSLRKCKCLSVYLYLKHADC